MSVILESTASHFFQDIIRFSPLVSHLTTLFCLFIQRLTLHLTFSDIQLAIWEILRDVHITQFSFVPGHPAFDILAPLHWESGLHVWVWCSLST
jgi:hypothetical protein